MKTTKIQQKYYLRSPGGEEHRVTALPATREQALTMASGLAGANPAPGRYTFIARFNDKQYGHTTLDQIVVNHYPDLGWGLSETRAYAPFSPTEEDFHLYGRHLKRLWRKEHSRLCLRRERRRGIPALQICDDDDAHPGAVLRIAVAGQPVCLRYIDRQESIGATLQLSAPDMDTALFMVEAIFGDWVNHKGIPLHTPPVVSRSGAEDGSQA